MNRSSRCEFAWVESRQVQGELSLTDEALALGLSCRDLRTCFDDSLLSVTGTDRGLEIRDIFKGTLLAVTKPGEASVFNASLCAHAYRSRSLPQQGYVHDDPRAPLHMRRRGVGLYRNLGFRWNCVAQATLLPAEQRNGSEWRNKGWFRDKRDLMAFLAARGDQFLYHVFRPPSKASVVRGELIWMQLQFATRDGRKSRRKVDNPFVDGKEVLTPEEAQRMIYGYARRIPNRVHFSYEFSGLRLVWISPCRSVADVGRACERIRGITKEGVVPFTSKMRSSNGSTSSICGIGG